MEGLNIIYIRTAGQIQYIVIGNQRRRKESHIGV